MDKEEPHEEQGRKKKEKAKSERKDYAAELLPPDEDVESKPPVVVVVQGSAKSGKSTLIRSLVRYYTGHKVAELKGPITIRTGKNQRLTLIECENSAASMIDLSKIADFVLLIIDASVGL